MSSRLFAAGGARGARTSGRVSDEELLAVAAHLTDRDRRLVRLVGEHRVLTTGQLAAAGFGSVITARHRLAVLVTIGVLRRFRPHREAGSAPWHYLLGPAGAAMLGAEDADDRKWLAAVRADRQVALAQSQRLAHLTGVNWFFVSLVAHARAAGGGAELQLWLNEAAAAEWLCSHVFTRFTVADLPHPDGLGVWAEDGRAVTFVLEHDTGTEHLPQLAAKLPGYGQLAKTLADADRTCPLVLFCFPGPRREQAARTALAACYDSAALRIATAAIHPEHVSPAGPVWLPLTPGWAGGRVALCALDTAIPDPWHLYRARQELARQQAARAESQALTDDDPGGDTDGLGAANGQC
jgi:Replication-relaxation